MRYASLKREGETRRTLHSRNNAQLDLLLN
jgi:hypothetical protein